MQRTTGKETREPSTPLAPEPGAGDQMRPRGNGAAPGADMAALGMGGGMGMGGGSALSLRNLRTFTSLKNPVFRLYYASMLAQMAAMSMMMISSSLLIYRIIGSATALGVMALANSLPMLFFSLFGGVMADRVQKKYVLIAGQALSAVVALFIALCLTLGYLGPGAGASWWILLAYSVFQGAVFGLVMPARQAMIAEIVDGEQLMNAVALNMFGMNILRLFAPALAGFFIYAYGFEAVYYAMAGMSLLGGFFVMLMPLTGTMTLRGRGAWADMKGGFTYVWQETTVFLILFLTLIMVLLSMPYMMLLPVFTEDILRVGERGLGMLISVSGIGAMAGSIFLASLPNKKRGLMFLVSGLILGLSLAGFSFSASWTLSLVMMVFVGLGQTVRMTLSNTLLQYYVTDEYRGRVMSIYMMEFGLTSFGVFFAGVLADSIGVQWSVGGLAIILVAMSLLMLIFVPRIRKLD